MQSSLGGAFRALVLLACLILTPLMAIPDVSFPDWIKKLSQGRWDGNWGGVLKSVGDATTTPAKQTASRPQRDGKTSGSLLGGLPATLGQAESGWPKDATAPVDQPAPRHDPMAEATGLSADRPVMRQEVPTQPTVLTPPPQNLQTPTEQLARFRAVEERLRALGAVHYLLEAWGNATEYYRFRCRMPVAGSTAAVRHFEATDSDGLAAMSKVLEEIEAWKARSL